MSLSPALSPTATDIIPYSTQPQLCDVVSDEAAAYHALCALEQVCARSCRPDDVAATESRASQLVADTQAVLAARANSLPLPLRHSKLTFLLRDVLGTGPLYFLYTLGSDAEGQPDDDGPRTGARIHALLCAASRLTGSGTGGKPPLLAATPR